MSEKAATPPVDITTGSTSYAASADSSLVSSRDSESSFEDYVPPPEVKVLPPAKYKLWLIVFVLVYFVAWVANEAELLEFLRFRGFLSPEAALFLMLAIIVFVLVYTTMDLVISLGSVTTKAGNVYGVEAWLRHPRTQWTYSRENIIFEILARIIHILEEGFAMLDAPPRPQGNNNSHDDIQFQGADRTCQRTLKIEHRIKHDKLEQYEKWLVRIRNAVQKANGLLRVNSSKILQEWDEETGTTTPAATTTPPDIPNDKAQQQEHPRDEEQYEPAQLHVIHVKFANIDYLNDWMLSPHRKALMKALEPLLAKPDVVKIQSARCLPDAFSDLLTRQGHSVPTSPPKKWKVWWLTTVALFITRRWAGSFLPYYFDQWGLAATDARLERLISLFISTFLNSYVMTPLMLFVFDHWLQHKDVEVKHTKDPWKTLDEGFTSIWSKIAITLAFYGGCIIAFVVKKWL